MPATKEAKKTKEGVGLRAYCDACKRQIEPLSAGLVEVNLTEVSRVEAAVREYERKREVVGPDGRVLAHSYSGADLLDYPEAVPWHVWHRACDPDPNEEHGTYYHFTLDRVGDAAGLLHWTAHLMEKSWLEDTNWADVIRAASDGRGALRCGPSKRTP